LRYVTPVPIAMIDNTRRPASRMDLPDSDIACAAKQFVFDVSPAFVADHSVRSYLFARELAAAKGLRGRNRGCVVATNCAPDRRNPPGSSVGPGKRASANLPRTSASADLRNETAGDMVRCRTQRRLE
jgi:hypothetical protein